MNTIRTIFKWIAISLNAFVILAFTAAWLRWDIIFRAVPEWFFFAMVIATALLSIAMLLTLSNGKSWLALYIQRRKLEEQFKIERLLSGSDRCRDFYANDLHHEN
jgi:hypothetical protein